MIATILSALICSCLLSFHNVLFTQRINRPALVWIMVVLPCCNCSHQLFRPVVHVY